MTRLCKKLKLSFAAAALGAAGLLGATRVAIAEPYDRYDQRSYSDDYRSVHGNLDYDRNRDGVLSYQERLFQYFDRDHDGRLVGSESRAYRDYLRGQNRRGYGGDRFGEYGDRSAEHLEEHDLNRDGVLDDYEMQDLHRHDQLEKLFQSYDRNVDGYLSFEETSRTPLRRHFRSADGNTDGYLSWTELEYYLKAPREYRRYQQQPTYRRGWRDNWIR